MIGIFAASKAGHDKNKVYIIIKEEGEYVYLADGVSRKLENPKRKNQKHIQPIHYRKDDTVIAKTESMQPLRDEEIAAAIRAYQKSSDDR